MARGWNEKQCKFVANIVVVLLTVNCKLQTNLCNNKNNNSNHYYYATLKQAQNVKIFAKKMFTNNSSIINSCPELDAVLRKCVYNLVPTRHTDTFKFIRCFRFHTNRSCDYIYFENRPTDTLIIHYFIESNTVQWSNYIKTEKLYYNITSAENCL